jgi:hypothetical protein
MSERPGLREALISECRRIEEYSKWNSASHFTAAAWLGRFHLGAGVIPFVLGGVGAWQGFKYLPVAPEKTALWASVALLVAGIVGSIISFWNPAEARVKHFTAGAHYKALEGAARRAVNLFPDEDDLQFRERVLALAAKYEELNETSAQSSDFAFWLATKKVRAGKYDPDHKLSLSLNAGRTS